MRIAELYERLDRAIPAELSCDWDNDGLMCCPNGAKTTRRVLLSLDVTEDTVERAVSGGFDCIVTHHPLIFKPIRSLNDTLLLRLVKNDISVFSFHTRLDALDGGVNDCLSELFGVRDTVAFGEGGIGRIGALGARMPALQFCEHVKELLRCPHVQMVLPNSFCQRIAIVGGEGGDFIADAEAAGADTFITGNAGYHALTDAARGGMNIICAGHYYTEQPVLGTLEAMIKKILPEVYTERFAGNVILGI